MATQPGECREGDVNGLARMSCLAEGSEVAGRDQGLWDGGSLGAMDFRLSTLEAVGTVRLQTRYEGSTRPVAFHRVRGERLELVSLADVAQVTHLEDKMMVVVDCHCGPVSGSF